MTAGPPSDGAPVPAGPTGPHPVYLFAGVPDGASTAAELRVPSDVPDDLVWADDRLDAVGDSVHLMRQMGADPAVLSTLTGFAGLERLLVWGKARATSGFVPAGVRIGVSVDRQLSWLRRVQGPEQFADILDLISPRVDRHRSMPDVFGDRSRRAKLMESLWAWGRSWQRFVEAGGVRLRAEADLDDRVAAAATWIGVVVETGARRRRGSACGCAPPSCLPTSPATRWIRLPSMPGSPCSSSPSAAGPAGSRRPPCCRCARSIRSRPKLPARGPTVGGIS